MQSGLTLFAFDCSGSIDGYSLYFTTIKSIIDKYYVKNRGDIFVMWDNDIQYKTYEEIQTWIESEKGFGLTDSDLIAKVLKEKGSIIKHLIITTDGYIESDTVKQCDELMTQLDWKPEYVTAFLIGREAKDVSVVVPYIRESPHIVYDVNLNKITIIEEVLPAYTKSFNKMHQITSKWIFIQQYPAILNYMFSYCRGNDVNTQLVDKINQLEQSLSQDPTVVPGYQEKIQHLKDLAHGIIKNNYAKFMAGLINAGVVLNRKMLSEIAINDAEGFKALVELSKKA